MIFSLTSTFVQIFQYLSLCEKNACNTCVVKILYIPKAQQLHGYDKHAVLSAQPIDIYKIYIECDGRRK